MRVIGHHQVTDWPKLGPSLLIASALVVAIRTARWKATAPLDPQVSDVDSDLDREVEFAIRITDRILDQLLRTKASLFAQRAQPIYVPTEDDVPK